MYRTFINSSNKMREEILIPHLRMFEIKFLPPTNYKGDRVKITDTRFEKSVIISYNYEDRGTLETALKFLVNKGIKYNSFSHDEKTKKYFIMTQDFETQIK